MKVKIYVVTHKKFKEPSSKIYEPIQVGKKFTGQDLKYLSDDQGENISYKNQNYCELTALYWIWKNDEESDVIGFTHYRRYFSKNRFFNNEKFFLNEKDIKRLLKEFDVIVPKKENWGQRSVREYYSLCAGKDHDFMETRKIIAQMCPAYLEDFDFIANQNEAFYCNMIITSRKILKEYCKWVFNILFELEKHINLTGYSKQEMRIYGYISEILLNVWIRYNGLKCKEIDVVNTDISFKSRIKKKILG